MVFLLITGVASRFRDLHLPVKTQMIVIFRIEQIPGRQCQLHIRPADRDTETSPQVKQLRAPVSDLHSGNPVLVGNILVFHMETHPLFLPGKRIPQKNPAEKNSMAYARPSYKYRHILTSPP